MELKLFLSHLSDGFQVQGPDAGIVGSRSDLDAFPRNGSIEESIDPRGLISMLLMLKTHGLCVIRLYPSSLSLDR